ncbi:MAG: META domain-containing protein [Exiguobacterium profundum]|nr:MAG: META domain-containing protein [Exiguobacterium profundum]
MSRIALATLLLSVALPALARDVSGEIGYLQRIALDPGATVVVELTGPGGMAGEYRAATGGKQVPLPFSISTDDTGPLFLRAAILVGGSPEWVSDMVPVDAGEADVNLGLIQLNAFIPMGFSSQMRCGDTVVDVGFVGDEARLRVGGVDYELPQAISGSGARYSDGKTPETMIWTKGDTAMVTVVGKELPDCVATAAPAALPFIARGNEPGWVLNVSAEGMVLSTQDGTELRTALPPSNQTEDGTVFATDQMTVTVSPKLCRDSMAGMVYPLTVSVTAKDSELTGCGGNPADLLKGNWVVQAIDGGPLPPDAEVTMSFVYDSVSGKSACNRYNAGFTLTGESLTFQPGPMTMMACDDALMAVERGFMDALAAVTSFDFDQDSGALVLMAQDRAVVTANPAP